MHLLLVSLVLALAVAVAAPVQAEARPAAQARVAQADVEAAGKTTETALAKVRAAEQKRIKLIADRVTMAQRYQRELAEVDKLKKQKASWRRDRQLRSKLASSMETAKALGNASAEITRLDVRLFKARKALVAAIDAELAAAPAKARAGKLVTLRRDVAAQVAPRKVKKIVLPDDEVDPLADPEELDLQAKALRDSEAELARQIASLERQVARFRKQAELRKQHQRADELATRDDSQPRRSSGSSGGRTSNDEAASEPQSDDGLDGDGPAGAFEGDPAAVLADVVDADTVDALRQAERSSDPVTKAAAAEQARAQVAKRLRALEKRRQEIERRARELRD